MFQTHQILLTQLPELLELLGYQELSTSYSTPHLSEDYKHTQRQSVLEKMHTTVTANLVFLLTKDIASKYYVDV